MHPATLLVAWTAVVAFSQLARGPMLWGLGLVVGALAVRWARPRARRLLLRVRILLLVLVVLFAFFTPGEAVLPALGRLAPTFEGLEIAAVHCCRLAIAVMLVALLLERLDQKTLVSGLVVLVSPLRCFGLSVERLAVRILLVFRYVESPPPGGWRALLIDEERHDPESLTVHFSEPSLRDKMLMAGLLLLIVWGVAL